MVLLLNMTIMQTQAANRYTPSMGVERDRRPQHGRRDLPRCGVGTVVMAAERGSAPREIRLAPGARVAVYSGLSGGQVSAQQLTAGLGPPHTLQTCL